MSNINQQTSNESHKFNQSRNYAFDSKTLSHEELVEVCANYIETQGFCVIDNLIPTKEVPVIRQEILEAQKKVRQNINAIKELVDSKKFNEKKLLESAKVHLRPVGREGRPSKPPNDIVWMPKYAQHLGNLNLVKVASKLLDDHLRIVQLHPKVIPVSNPKDASDISLGNDMLGLPRIYKGPESARDWHTDWPHDPSAYGGDNPEENIGFIRQPYPDVTMCLVIIFYFNDVDEKSGGTWIVPGSHKDGRTPRGPSDGITLSAPIPGEIQIKGNSGSVLIQDSRLWHSSPLHNFSDHDRVAVVTRWCPWWLSADDYAPRSRYNVVCRPLSHSEFLDLPAELKPLMRHLCPKELDTIQQPLLERAKASVERTRWAYQQLKENPNNLTQANANIRVSAAPLNKKTKLKKNK